MRIILRIFLIAASLVGLACSFVLRAMQVPNSPLLSRFCSPSETFDCSVALTSRWATVWPFSTATWGELYFVTLFSWFAVLGLPNRRGRHWHAIPTIVCSAGLAISVWLTITMATQLASLCPWCLAVHGVNLFIFVACIFAWWTLRAPKSVQTEGIVIAVAEQPIYPGAGRLGGACVLPLVALLAACGLTILQLQAQAAVLRRNYLKAANSAEYIAWQWSNAPRVDIPLAHDELTAGDPRAPHTVILFSDFQCPWCRQLDGFMHTLLKQRPHELRVIFKHYPLNAACNPNVAADPGEHTFACTAARMAESVRQLAGHDKAVEYGSLLFEHAPELSQQPYARLAKQIGVPAKAVNMQAVDARIMEDVALAHKLGVIAAGTVFLDGRRMPAWQIVDTEDMTKINHAATMQLWDNLLKNEPASQPAASP